MRSGTPRLELRGVVLNSDPPLELVVTEGEVVAVAGWGSSTLLWAIAGIAAPAAGEIVVDGRPIGDRDQALAARVALITPGNALASLLTAFENIFLPLAQDRGAALPTAKRAQLDDDPVEAARRALDAVGLLDSADHLIEDLSGGQQQRVAIARALVNEPAILMADEPTGNLDTRTSREVIGLFRKLNEEQKITVILVTHDQDVARNAKRTIVLRDGYVVEDTSNFTQAIQALHSAAELEPPVQAEPAL